MFAITVAATNIYWMPRTILMLGMVIIKTDKVSTHRDYFLVGEKTNENNDQIIDFIFFQGDFMWLPTMTYD